MGDLARKRQALPGAVALCLVMVLSSAFVVAAPGAKADNSSSGSQLSQATASSVPLPSNGNITPDACLSITIWFNESGMPSGDSWAVTLHSTKKSSTSSSIEFSGEECNEVYAYTVSPPTGWYALPASGNISSDTGKAGVAVLIFSCSDLTISFGETGLPGGDSWSVTLNSTKETSSNSTIYFTGEHCNVHYPYTVSPPTGLFASPSSGAVEGTTPTGPPGVAVTISTCNPTTTAVAITSVAVTSNATNVSMAWDESPAGYSTTLDWGNTTQEVWSQSVVGSGSYSVPLNFLEPSTTYYYEIVALPPACTSHYTYLTGTYNGTFTTGSDSLTTFSGTVTDPNGSVPPTNLLVLASCVLYGRPNSRTLNGTTWAKVTSTGTYSLSEPEWFNTQTNTWYACSEGGGGYNISVINSPNVVEQGGSFDNPQWTNHWNESVVTWGPQIVKFILPTNLVTGPLVEVADFSNALTSDGFPNSTLAYTNETTYTTGNGFCWTALFVSSGCSAASSAVSAGKSYSAIGGNLVVTERFRESGTILFDSFSRVWSGTALSYYQSYSPPVNEPATWPITDTMEPGNTSTYLLYDWGGVGSDNQGIMVYEGRPDTGYATASTTHASYQVQGFQLDLGVDLYGVSVGVTVFSLQWSQTSSTTYSTSLSWTLVGDSSTVPVCYVVYGIGGSSSASGTTTDSIGVWAYDPTGSSGNYSCSVPT